MTDACNEFGVLRIRSDELEASDVPMPDAEWSVIGRFALTFDGYSEHPEDCGDIANAAAERFAESGELQPGLSELRTSLFFEQRRWRHFGEEPDDDSIRYIHALVAAIRRRVEVGDPAATMGETTCRQRTTQCSSLRRKGT